MKIIFAQGNPGTDFHNTRHNVGFAALDAYAEEKSVNFSEKTKFHAYIAEYTEAGEKVLLVKPTTYYNETGQAARALADFYKIGTTDILAIHDELALQFGTLRTREKGSDAGNNGVKSLNSHLGQDYIRIRVGIANDLLEHIGAHDFVLSRFTTDEINSLNSDILPKIIEIIDDFVAGKHQITSHKI